MSSVILAPSIETSLWDHFPNAEHPIYGARPMLRGRFHQVAAVASVPVGIHLVVSLAGPAAQFTLLVYALTTTLMFGVSAAYHRLAQGVLARFWMRRLDHSMILVSIAGGTTPIALLGIGGPANGCVLGRGIRRSGDEDDQADSRRRHRQLDLPALGRSAAARPSWSASKGWLGRSRSLDGIRGDLASHRTQFRRSSAITRFGTYSL